MAKIFQTLHKGKRSTQIRLPFSASKDLYITVRRFKTSKSNRSQKSRQWVIPFPIGQTKEVCLSFEIHPKFYSTVLGFRVGAAALIILGLSGGLFSAQHLTRQVSLEPVAANPTAQSVTKPVPTQVTPLGRSEPTRIMIDDVKIDAPIVGTGLRSDGTIRVPNSPTQVGWYNQGPTPGERGPAVLVGHVDYIDDIAVFWRLRDLQAGDTFKVSRADGSVATFRIDSIQQFDQENFPTEAVYGGINYAGIRVITCGGTFNEVTHHYSENTVVFGTLVSYSK